MSAGPLKGEGVILRPLTLEDAEALFVAHSDAETHLFWSSPPHASVEQTRADIAELLARKNGFAWAITEEGGQALGRIALFVVREGVGEVGVIMRREATGRGFASRALDLVIAYGFGPLGLHRIGADIDPGHANSISLFLRAGFQREGLLRGNWKTHLGVRDSVIMGKLRD